MIMETLLKPEKKNSITQGKFPLAPEKSRVWKTFFYRKVYKKIAKYIFCTNRREFLSKELDSGRQ